MNNSSNTLLLEMLKWRINIFACLPHHVEAVTDEFEQLLGQLTPTIGVHSHGGYQLYGRGALQLVQETTPPAQSIRMKFLSIGTIAVLSAEHPLFGECNKYGESIRQLLLYRTQTYDFQTEVVVFWTAPEKVGVALWTQFNPNLAPTSNINLNNPEFPF